MKVGIITYHQVYNYGSCLQAYATQTLVDSLGYESEIINYLPDRYLEYGKLKSIYKENKFYHKNKVLCLGLAMMKYPSYRKQKNTFSKFEKYLKLTPVVSDDTIKQYAEAYDIYCTGSDQVWNNFFKKDFIGAYFLEFVNNGAKCFSYAASFGKEDFDADDKNKIKRMLNKYAAISVREDSAVRILQDIGITNVKQVLDPVYMLTREQWRNIKEDIRTPEKYILVYQLHNDSRSMKVAESLAKDTGLPVVRLAVSYHQKRTDNTIVLPSVNQFIELIDGADYVVTDSFHGTSFSVILNKQFFVTYPSRFSSRLSSALSIFDLLDRAVAEGQEVDVGNVIDYTLINEKLVQLRNDNIGYLRKTLNELER